MQVTLRHLSALLRSLIIANKTLYWLYNIHSKLALSGLLRVDRSRPLVENCQVKKVCPLPLAFAQFCIRWRIT